MIKRKLVDNIHDRISLDACLRGVQGGNEGFFFLLRMF